VHRIVVAGVDPDSQYVSIFPKSVQSSSKAGSASPEKDLRVRRIAVDPMDSVAVGTVVGLVAATGFVESKGPVVDSTGWVGRKVVGPVGSKMIEDMATVLEAAAEAGCNPTAVEDTVTMTAGSKAEEQVNMAEREGLPTVERCSGTG
jgi:hypothetical protein